MPEANTLEFSPTLLLKHDIHKDNSKKYTRVDGGKPMRPHVYTKYKKPRNSKSRRVFLHKKNVPTGY